MSVFPGDNIGGYRVDHLVAVQGLEGCQNMTCTRRMISPTESVCVGYHCPLCDAPTNSYGHHDCPRKGDR